MFLSSKNENPPMQQIFNTLLLSITSAELNPLHYF